MKLRHCCNLTTTPNFSEITNLEELDLEGCVNLVTVHPSIEMLKRLVVLNMTDCKLEVLHELPPSLYIVSAEDCTSLCSITRSSKDPFKITDLSNCPKMFTNLAIDGQGSISETQCLDSSITSHGSTNQMSSFL
ncbi:NB-ARC domains-containing protein [Tanacetum coccineum]